jgi:two-component system, cell cycle sensor histidine kinase and response regulator CckA
MKVERAEEPDNAESETTEGLAPVQLAALDVMAYPVYISTRAGTIIWVNRAFEQLSGYTRAEAVGQNTRLLKCGEQPVSFDKNMWETVFSGQEWRGELLNQRKDGSNYYEEITITPIRNAAGEITHFIAIKRDITERKRVEERLNLLAQVVENSSEMIVIGDASGRISFANQSLLQATGYEESDLIGKRFDAILLSANNPRNLGQEIRRRTLSGRGWSGECLRTRKDGSEFPIFLSTGLLRDNDGVIIGTFGISQDITDRKRLAEQFAAAQKMQAVGQLAGGVAHDFNNILGVILGQTDLLMESLQAGDPRWQRLEEIRNAGHRATALTQQLLAFSRKQAFQPKVLDLNVLVANLKKMLRPMVREDIELVTSLKPGIGNIKADLGQVEQVIMNLVVNARDAISNGGKITIETADADLDEAYCRTHPAIQPGRYVMVAVSDTGIGMDAKTQARIFEPFFTTKEQGKGTGLGLATVYGIVKQSGGYIWVYSHVGMGTTFKIYFPRSDEPTAVMEIDRDKLEIPVGSETILLAEDAEDLRELISTFLNRNGYTVLAANSSNEAIELAERDDQPIHLLLTDMVMPGINGRELANRLTLKRPGMRVLYMSGYTSDVIVDQGVMEAGILLIEKPFSEAALMRKLREVLDHT